MLNKTGLTDLLQATFACQIFQGCFALLIFFFLWNAKQTVKQQLDG